jgi:hypothetical protein
MGRHPVAVVISHITYAQTMKVNTLDLVGEGYMEACSGNLERTNGNHPRSCSRTQENQEKPVSRWPVAGPSGY